MKKIAFLGGKGGITKSSLARAVTVRLVEMKHSCVVVDFDEGQETFFEWAELRQSAGRPLGFDVIGGAKLADLRAVIKEGASDYCVVDAGAYNSKDIPAIAQLVDLVVVPSRFSRDDMRPAARTINGLLEMGVPAERFAVAFSGALESAADYRSAQAFFEGVPYHVLPGYIPALTSYSQAQDRGLAIIETPYAGPSYTARQMINGMIERLNEVTNG